MKGKIIRCGNSSAIIVNSKFMRDLGIKRGDEVQVKYYKEKGQMVIYFPGIRQLSLTSQSK